MDLKNLFPSWHVFTPLPSLKNPNSKPEKYKHTHTHTHKTKHETETHENKGTKPRDNSGRI